MSDPDREAVASHVSRETLARLDTFVDLLRRWQSIKNLVGPGTLSEVWPRHVADSLQLAAHAPQRGLWVDFGSGAGFPGLVLGILAAETADMRLVLVESNARKSAFLREAARATGARAEIRDARIEAVASVLGNATAVTARAVAPLATLLEWAKPLLIAGAVGLFPKGRDVDAELTAARERWRFDADLLPSRTAPDARIVRVTALSPVTPLEATQHSAR